VQARAGQAPGPEPAGCVAVRHPRAEARRRPVGSDAACRAGPSVPAETCRSGPSGSDTAVESRLASGRARVRLGEPMVLADEPRTGDAFSRREPAGGAGVPAAPARARLR